MSFLDIRNPKLAYEVAKKVVDLGPMKNAARDDNRYLLKRCYVTKQGEISKHGSIRIFSNSVNEATAVTYASDEFDFGLGLELWSPVLYSFRKNGFRAKISPKGDAVTILKKKKTVMAIPAAYLAPVHMSLRETVVENGWLLSGDEEHRNWLTKALLLSENGKHPQYCDNSNFLKVSSELIGKKLLVLEMGYSHENNYGVFNSEGELIKHEVLLPLSYQRWEPGSRFAAFSRG